MAYEIIQSMCDGCGTCYKECPIDAITEENGVYVIDSDECVGCGKCAAECPNDAIWES